MDNQLKKNIIALSIWLEDLWGKVEKIKDTEHGKEAIQLLTVATAISVFLLDFGEEVDIQAINTCIFMTISIMSLIRAHLGILGKKKFESLDLATQNMMYANLRQLRYRCIEDYKKILDNYDYPDTTK